MVTTGDPLPWPPRAGRAALHGRQPEIESLTVAYREAQQGRLNVVLLAGDAGIGKSRLLEDFPPPALAAGATILRGSASSDEGMPPYLPFLEALGGYVAVAPEDRLRQQLGAGASVLAALLLEIPVRLGPLPEPAPLSPPQARLRLFEAAAAFLTTLAADGPVILFLDDLHWADAATCDLLAYVARRLRSSRVLIAGAYREAEGEANAAFTLLLAELNRLRVLLPLAVKPLPLAATGAVAADLLRGSVSPDTVDLLYRQSEGNPFFLEELLSNLVTERVLVPTADGWQLAGGTTGPRPLPAGVVAVIRQRLSHLPADLVDLLRIAALMGRSFDPLLLADVSSQPAEEVEDRLLLAARAGLVRPEEDGGFAFAHHLVRTALAGEIGPARRQRLHQAIGEALAGHLATSARRAADLAFHFMAAGDRERALQYTLQAGEQALGLYALEEARQHFRSAVDLLESIDRPAEAARAHQGAGRSAMLAGDYDAAARSLRSSLAAYLAADDVSGAARAGRELGDLLWRQEAVEEARLAYERVLHLLGPGDQPEAVETLLRLADLLVVSLNRHAAGLTRGEQAMAMVERLGDRRLAAAAHRTLGSIRIRSNDLEAGRELLEHGLLLARELADPVLAAEACGYLANACSWLGRTERAREVTLLQDELAGQSQDPFQRRHVYAYLAYLAIRSGDFDDAAALLDRQTEINERLDSPEPAVLVGLTRGLVAYYQGRLDEAAALIDPAIAAIRRTSPGTLVWYLGSQALVRAEQERRAETLALLDEAETLAGALDERATARCAAFSEIIIAAERAGARERAAVCYAKLLPFAGQQHVVLSDRALGVAAACRGDSAAARHHFDAAVAFAQRAGSRPELALSLLQRGGLDPVRGEPGDARAGDLATGFRLAESLGLQSLVRRFGAVGAADASRPDRPTTGPDGLTPRELEVLRLIGQGRTNREIADILVLSAGTVANHVTAIFTKTGADNRAAAAAYAVRHGLV